MAQDVSYGAFQRQLSVVAGQIDLAVDRVFHDKFDLNNTEWQVLAALQAGPATFYEVVARCAIDKARVSRAQKRLVDRGYVQSMAHALDGRKIVLSLTPDGGQLLAKMGPEVERIETWVLGGLSPAEQQILRTALGRLADRCLATPSDGPQIRRRPPADI